MLRKNNKGITMIEVLLAIAITAMLGTLVTGFIIFTTRSYGKSLNESTLQEDAQVILAQLNNYIINADDTVEYKVNGTLCKSDALSGAASFSTKELCIYSNVGTGKTVEYIKWTATDKKLTYRMDNIDASGSVSTSIAEEVLATKISDFQVDLTNLDSSRQVKVALAVDGTAGEVYTADATVYLRNGMVSSVSSNPTTPVVSAVNSVTVIPASKELKFGESWDFNARVYGTNNPSQEVTWTIEGNTSTQTTVNADTGEVYVAPSEDAETIVVRATSVQDNTKSGIGYVYVDMSTKLSLGTIRNYWIYTGNSLYLYARPDGNLESEITWSVTTSQGADSYSLSKINDFNAARFVPNKVGDYTVHIEGVVDGIVYKDKAIVHVGDIGDEYNQHGNNRSMITIYNSSTDWDYWLCPGESITLETTVDESKSDYAERKWSYSSSSRILSTDYSAVEMGDNKEKVVVTVSDSCRTGEIHLRATVDNGYYSYYDEITIHVYKPFDYPYVIETTEMDDLEHASENSYYLRNMIAGPVRMAASSDQLKVLSEEKLTEKRGAVTNNEYLTSTYYWDQNITLPMDSSKTNVYIKSDSGGLVKIDPSNTLMLGSNCKMLITENDLTINAQNIVAPNDTIIWVKGNHTLTLEYQDILFDGLIYAPEGTVNIQCKSGMFRGVIIAKKVGISGRGDGELGFMEKQSVMDLANDLKRPLVTTP